MRCYNRRRVIILFLHYLLLDQLPHSLCVSSIDHSNSHTGDHSYYPYSHSSSYSLCRESDRVAECPYSSSDDDASDDIFDHKSSIKEIMKMSLVMEYTLCTKSDIKHCYSKSYDTAIEPSSMISSSYGDDVDDESLYDHKDSLSDRSTSSIECKSDSIDCPE